MKPTEEEVLAGCRAVAPGLFRESLEPAKGDGPATRAQIATIVRDTRAILEAAAAVRAAAKP